MANRPAAHHAPAPNPRHIAIVGAGPIGLEAALYGRAIGHDVTVYERGAPAEHVRRWSFVELFSPWGLNVSSLGLDVLRRHGVPIPESTVAPTGAEFIAEYLEPIARGLGDSLRCGEEVVAIGRRGLLKGEEIGTAERGARPFRLLVRSGPNREERYDEADVVIDASGVYASPAPLGVDGLPAKGELTAGAARPAPAATSRTIRRHVCDIEGGERARFAGRTTLVVGSGYSAATALASLRRVTEEAPSTRVVWVRRSSGAPMEVIDDDPLPLRRELRRELLEIAERPPDGWTVLSDAGVESVGILPAAGSADGAAAPRWSVEISTPEGVRRDSVNEILSLVGYRPDLELSRELQVHQCYASEGPMRLAAALLGAGGGDGDCLAASGFGPDSLTSPEPGFFVVGNKSYGRRSDFLLRIGREQIRDVFRLVESRPDLDLYAESR